jgi:hypothetical protein
MTSIRHSLLLAGTVIKHTHQTFSWVIADFPVNLRLPSISVIVVSSHIALNQ